MTVKIGINGFGRIGRSIFRAISLDDTFADIEVVGKANGEKGVLDLLSQKTVDVAVLDMKMPPGKNGIELNDILLSLPQRRHDLDAESQSDSNGDVPDSQRFQFSPKCPSGPTLVLSPFFAFFVFNSV